MEPHCGRQPGNKACVHHRKMSAGGGKRHSGLTGVTKKQGEGRVRICSFGGDSEEVAGRTRRALAGKD